MIDHSTKDVISVWIGKTNRSTDDFNKYVEGMGDPEFDCPAKRDIGYIDFDFFVAFGTSENKIIPIEELVKESGTHSSKTDSEIVKKAKEMGITEGNALYSYRDATFQEDEPGKLYNDLGFIGTFSDPRKKLR